MPLDCNYYTMFERFTEEYDTENPITKRDGNIRLLELRRK